MSVLTACSKKGHYSQQAAAKASASERLSDHVIRALRGEKVKAMVVQSREVARAGATQAKASSQLTSRALIDAGPATTVYGELSTELYALCTRSVAMVHCNRLATTVYVVLRSELLCTRCLSLPEARMVNLCIQLPCGA